METEEEIFESLYSHAKHLYDAHLSFDEIEKRLRKKSNDELVIKLIIKRLKKVHYAVKTKSGLIKIGFGVSFLIIGFLITFVNFHANQSFTFVMYSFTTVGLVLVFWGLFDIIG